ncbi:MAG: hypothetical protein AAFN08_06670 [Cyanobacteria bacterium J06559_3]
MTFQSALQPFYQPFVDAARLLDEYGVAIYEALTSDTAKDIYKTLWILIQVAFWLSVLAVRYTIKLVCQFKAYYDAEWSQDVNRLIQWVITYPDRCLESECTPTDESPTPDTTTTDTATVALQTEASVTVEDNATPEATDLAVVDTETTISAQPTALPDALQSIIDSDGTATTKLRKLATHYNVPWRNTRGKGKHMKNADLKAALQDLCPKVLAAL